MSNLLGTQSPIKHFVCFIRYTLHRTRLRSSTVQIPSAQNNEAGDGIIGEFPLTDIIIITLLRTSTGLGPNYGSNIYQEMGSVAGAAILDRIFLQNITTPNYLTVLLGRSAGISAVFFLKDI